MSSGKPLLFTLSHCFSPCPCESTQQPTQTFPSQSAGMELHWLLWPCQRESSWKPHFTLFLKNHFIFCDGHMVRFCFWWMSSLQKKWVLKWCHRQRKVLDCSSSEWVHIVWPLVASGLICFRLWMQGILICTVCVLDCYVFASCFVPGGRRTYFCTPPRDIAGALYFCHKLQYHQYFQNTYILNVSRAPTDQTLLWLNIQAPLKFLWLLRTVVRHSL